MGEPARDADTPGHDGGSPEPRQVLPPVALLPRERRTVWLVCLAPPIALAAVLLPLAWFGSGRFGDALGNVLLHGGLLALAAGFVTVDRLHARQCPACRSRNAAGAQACRACGYDLATRPRYACQERHAVRLDPGICSCGRRLQLLHTSGGLGAEIVVMLRVGAWLLAFLLGMGLLFRFAGS